MGLNGYIFMGRADIVYRLSVWSDFGGSGKKFHQGQGKKCRDFMQNSEEKNAKTNKVKFSLPLAPPGQPHTHMKVKVCSVVSDSLKPHRL